MNYRISYLRGFAGIIQVSATDFPNMCGGFPGLTSVGFPGFPGFPEYLCRISRAYLRRISRISQNACKTLPRRISQALPPSSMSHLIIPTAPRTFFPGANPRPERIFSAANPRSERVFSVANPCLERDFFCRETAPRTRFSSVANPRSERGFFCHER